MLVDISIDLKWHAVVPEVHTPGDMIMAGPGFDAGRSQPRNVKPSRVLNSTSSRGNIFFVNCIFLGLIRLEVENEMKLNSEMYGVRVVV